LSIKFPCFLNSLLISAKTLATLKSTSKIFISSNHFSTFCLFLSTTPSNTSPTQITLVDHKFISNKSNSSTTSFFPLKYPIK